MSQSLAFFQSAFEAAPVGMLIVDARGAIVEANRQLEVLLGYERGTLVGQSLELLVDGPADQHRAHRERFFKNVEARPMGFGRDLYGRHKEGHRVPVEIGLNPLTTPEGVFVLATVVDLTERKRADEQFRLAIEAAPNGMLLVDERGAIVLVNRQIEVLFGYSRTELIGRSVDTLVPARFRPTHPDKRTGFMRAPTARPMGAGRELFALRKDGTEMPVEIGLSPIRTAAGHFVLSSIVDITERMESQDKLQTSLREKEILLRELHHRAKNNLQLIASLLDLAQDSPSVDVLKECRDRIHSIALVHEKLYQSGTVAAIELEDYLRSLAEQVAHAWTRPEGAPVNVLISAPTVSLPLDQAIPCGLIVNELVTNAFKHAFPDSRSGTVEVSAERRGEELAVSVKDDGVGLPPGEVPRGHIGLELVHALARQLRGAVRFDSSPAGTRATLNFRGGAS